MPSERIEKPFVRLERSGRFDWERKAWGDRQVFYKKVMEVKYTWGKK